MPSIRTRLAAATVVAGLVVAAPAVAFAGPDRPARPERPERGERPDRPERPDRDPADAKAACLKKADVRLAALDRASTRLAGAKHVTDDTKASLEAILADTSTSLTELRGEIDAETDPAELRALCSSIFTDHRVFVLVLPRTRYVAGSDIALAAAGKGTAVADRLDEAVAKAAEAGHDVTEAQASLEAMRAAVASAAESAKGVPGMAMDLTPADWNADHQVLVPARQAIKSARGDLREARRLARETRQTLRNLT